MSFVVGWDWIQEFLDEEERARALLQGDNSPQQQSKGLEKTTEEITGKPILVDRTNPFVPLMKMFGQDDTTDFKRVLYNMLVLEHNKKVNQKNRTDPWFLSQISLNYLGSTKNGFCFNREIDPMKTMAELYAFYLRSERLDVLDISSLLVQDLYKFYARSCVELLRKYFIKIDDYTYLYADNNLPLFVAEETLEQATKRIKKITPKKSRKRSSSDTLE